MFLQSGASVSEPVSLTEPVLAVAVGDGARDEGASDECVDKEDCEAQNEEEDGDEEEGEKKKPFCMDYGTYLKCFEEAGKFVLGERYSEELPQMVKFRQYALAKARDLKVQKFFFEGYKQSHEADDPDTASRCEGLLRWQNNYTHYKDEEMCFAFFAKLFELPLDARADVYAFQIGLENSRKHTMASVSATTYFTSLHHEVENIDSLVSARSPSAAGGEGAEVNRFANCALKTEITHAVSTYGFKDPRLFCSDKNSIVDVISALPTFRGTIAPDVKVRAYSLQRRSSRMVYKPPPPVFRRKKNYFVLRTKTSRRSCRKW